jgi:H+/gluconate symporter-like permease
MGLVNDFPISSRALTAGATNCAIPVINACADVGFGTVVGGVAGFKLVSGTLMTIPGTPLISLSIATQLLCGITGSASGGFGIAMELFGKQYLAMGLNPEVIHRIAALATAGLDVISHNGAVITALYSCENASVSEKSAIISHISDPSDGHHTQPHTVQGLFAGKLRQGFLIFHWHEHSQGRR